MTHLAAKAVKEVRAAGGGALSAGAIRRLRREAEAARRVRHPGVAACLLSHQVGAAPPPRPGPLPP